MIDEQRMKQHLAYYTAANWDAFKADLANEVVFEEVATGQRGTGVDAYMSVVQRWKKAFPDLKATVTNVFIVGDRVITELDWEGTQTGPIEGPLGTIQPTNRRGRVSSVSLSTIKNDKIVATRHYFDMLGLLSQLGVVPAIAPTAQPTAPTGAARTRH